MERLILEDMIKALKCISSQDADGDCYMEHENFKHMEDGDLSWMKDIAELLEELKSYKEAEK